MTSFVFFLIRSRKLWPDVLLTISFASPLFAPYDITSRGKHLVHNIKWKILSHYCVYTHGLGLSKYCGSIRILVHPSINHVGMFVCRSLTSFSNYIVRPIRVISAVMFSSCLELMRFFFFLCFFFHTRDKFCRIPSIHPAVLFFVI